MVGRVCTEAAQRKRAEPRGTWEEEEEEEERGRKRDSRQSTVEIRMEREDWRSGENAGLGVRVAEREMRRVARVARTGWKSG